MLHALDLVAVGYSLGLAASVLWLGALGDRYGRKMMLIQGARFTLLFGYLFCFLGFGTMFALWSDHNQYWQVGIGDAMLGIGVGLAGTPASHSLTGSVPVSRAGMASGTADLQRDLGGAFMQSIFGALLTAGYAAAVHAAIAAARMGPRSRAARRPR
jgi:MFS transporter, DHA2 family, multidrug resistance protein